MTPPKKPRTTRTCVLFAGMIAPLMTAQADEAGEVTTLEEIVVVGTTPLAAGGLPARQLPYSVQRVGAAEISNQQTPDLPGLMNERLGSVSLNQAQNNPLQPDLQFRGFTASPLLGLPQGVSVFQNGVRINDAFGDAVNWDLLPQSAVRGMTVSSGSNPLFGLNTLGGAVSIEMKNGFDNPGLRAQAIGGSFDRFQGYAEGGWNDGTLGAYVNVEYFDEQGWRDHSPSRALNLFSSFGWRGEGSAVDLDLSYADTDLTGNGASPIQLLEEDRSAIFTHPDNTKNTLFGATLSGEQALGGGLQLAGNVFYRKLDTDAFNGDGGEFEECEDDDLAGLLCPEGGDDDDANGEVAGSDDDDEGHETTAPLLDTNGNPIAATDADGNPYNAINNISSRDQESYGGEIQLTWDGDLFGRTNQFLFGGGYYQGDAQFRADVEVARLNTERGTIASGIFEQDGITRLDSSTRTYSLFLSNTTELTPELSLTLSGRFNETEVKNRDRSGQRPDLDGTHDYSRFNPAIGLAYNPLPEAGFYAGYSESSRAPTPIELACSDPENECRLPNAFLADPPLEQVVAHTFELGMRGRVGVMEGLDYHLGLFQTINSDDIIFQAGGPSGNQGYFDNIGDTRRRGVELKLSGDLGKGGWYLAYTYLDATFRDAFFSNSPNHPLANAEGNILVEPGDRIPGIPRNNLKLGMDWDFVPQLTLGFSVVYNSGIHYRGDESNQLDKIPGYTLVNLRGEYRINDRFAFVARVENLFDEDYASFGLLGEPDEVLGPSADDPRFQGPGAPRGIWAGVRLAL